MNKPGGGSWCLAATIPQEASVVKKFHKSGGGVNVLHAFSRGVNTTTDDVCWHGGRKITMVTVPRRQASVRMNFGIASLYTLGGNRRFLRRFLHHLTGK